MNWRKFDLGDVVDWLATNYPAANVVARHQGTSETLSVRCNSITIPELLRLLERQFHVRCRLVESNDETHMEITPNPREH